MSLVDPNDLKAVRKTIFRLAGPSLVEMLLINFMQMLNMVLVGRVGPEAVAVVGLTSQPYLLLIAVFMTLNVGTTVIVARSVGAGKLDEANRAASQAFALNIVLSIIAVAVGYLFAEELLRMMGATDDVLKQGLTYAEIIFLSIGFNTISMALTAILRGAGDTRTPMKINVLSNIMVVALGFPLIYGLFGLPAMGVTGAAVATIVSQLISMIWVIIVMFSGKYTVHLTAKSLLQLDRGMIDRILKIGLPTAVEQIVMRLGMLVFCEGGGQPGDDRFSGDANRIQRVRPDVYAGHGVLHRRVHAGRASARGGEAGARGKLRLAGTEDRHDRCGSDGHRIYCVCALHHDDLYAGSFRYSEGSGRLADHGLHPGIPGDPVHSWRRIARCRGYPLSAVFDAGRRMGLPCLIELCICVPAQVGYCRDLGRCGGRPVYPFRAYLFAVQAGEMEDGSSVKKRRLYAAASIDICCDDLEHCVNYILRITTGVV